MYREKVERIFKETLAVQEDFVVVDAMKPNDIVEWDSLGHMKLISKLEEGFNVKFDFNEILEFDSIASIVAVLERKLG